MNIENKGIMQGIAAGLEIMLRTDYLCDRGGVGGIIDSDWIRNERGAFFYCMVIALLKYYSPESANQIDEFIEEINEIKDNKMDEIENKVAEKIYNDFHKVHKAIKKGS
jgi:hypothetical protein